MTNTFHPWLYIMLFADNSKVLHDLEPKHKVMLLEKISTDIPLKVGSGIISLR